MTQTFYYHHENYYEWWWDWCVGIASIAFENTCLALCDMGFWGLGFSSFNMAIITTTKRRFMYTQRCEKCIAGYAD